MADDIDRLLDDSARTRTFAATVARGYLAPAFGAISKGEADLLLFGALAELGVIDINGPIFDIARKLNITPVKARRLLFQLQLRRGITDDDLRQGVVAALQKSRFMSDGTYIAFGIESPILREALIARLKDIKIFADASFSREMIRLPLDAFSDFIAHATTPQIQAEFRQKLVGDKVAPDRSFKALFCGVLKGMAGKVAGKAAEPLIDLGAEHLTALVSGLFGGGVAASVEMIHENAYFTEI